MLFVLLAFTIVSVVRSQCENCVAVFAENGGCDLLGSGLSEQTIAENMSNVLPTDCLMMMAQCEDAARTFCAGDMSCTDCSATFVEKGGCELGILGLSQDEIGAKMMEILPMTCLVQMEDCGQKFGEACIGNMDPMSCSDCSATFVEEGGCELGMSGLSEDEMGAKMWEMLPTTCMMQMGDCGQQLGMACMGDMENMSCSDCSATFVEKGGCELWMSGLPEDEIGTKMMEILPMACLVQMEDCGQKLGEACMGNMDPMSCSECSATFVEKGGCELVTAGREEDDMGDQMREILPLACMMQMDDCAEHLMEGCGASAEVCQPCVEEFAARGGCPLLNEEEDVEHLIPDGCHLCGMAAIEYCKTEGGGSKKPSKRRQATKKTKSGKTSKPTSRKRRTGKDNSKPAKPTKGGKKSGSTKSKEPTKGGKQSAGRKSGKSGKSDQKLRR